MAKKNEESKELLHKSGELAVVPDYIKQGQSRGNEEVTSDDLQIPRIEVIQAISPQLKKSEPEYIEDAEQGLLFNTLTGELLPNPLVIIPVYYRRVYLAWKDRKKGGGLRGIFDDMVEGEQAVAQMEDRADIELQETGEHIVIYGFEDGSILEAAISMSRSKLKVSRKFNSLIRQNGNDRFSRQYLLTTIEDKNAAGDSYWNFHITNNHDAPWPSPEAYKYAEQLYQSIAAGRRKISTSYAGAQGTDGDRNGGDEDDEI